jgi:hypothetical protein
VHRFAHGVGQDLSKLEAGLLVSRNSQRRRQTIRDHRLRLDGEANLVGHGYKEMASWFGVANLNIQSMNACELLVWEQELQLDVNLMALQDCRQHKVQELRQ